MEVDDSIEEIKDIVTYEQAEKLKELEFGELVFFFYVEGEKILKVGEEPINWNNGVNFISAPYQEDIQRWLRIKFCCVVNAEPRYDCQGGRK